MPFKRLCASESMHSVWGCTETKELTSRVPAKVREKLLELSMKKEKSHYSKSAPNFCKSCIKKVYELNPDLDSEIAVEADIEPPSKMPKVDIMDLTKLDEAARIELAYNLGRIESDTCKPYAAKLSSQKGIDDLLTLDVNQSHSGANVLQSFLSGLQKRPMTHLLAGEGTSSSSIIQHSGYKIFKTIESMLDLTSMNLVLPAHFRESVVLYTLTGSKLALKILGARGAHASYKTVKTWLASLSQQQPAVVVGDIVVAFDNNQVLQRRWKVKLHNEVKCNIVTTIVYFVIKRNGQVLQNPTLKPGLWLNRDISEDEKVKVKYIDKDKAVKDAHYEHLYAFLQLEIQKVAEEQKIVAGTNKFEDLIDQQVAAEKKSLLYKKCYNCLFEEIPRSRHMCPNCKVNVTKSKMQSLGLDATGNVTAKQVSTTVSREPEVYKVVLNESFGSRHQQSLHYEKQHSKHSEYEQFEHLSLKEQEKPSAHVLVPAYVNPCSYDAVSVVLQNIGQKIGLTKYGGNRLWAPVVCDGVPYNLCKRIIATMHRCSKCDDLLNGKAACNEHKQESHSEENVTFEKEFDWVLLQPGLGHIEMNMVKGLVEIGWDVFWKKLAMCLNFRSEAALHCAKKVTDHHKGWTMCRVARTALTRELVLPFVRQELVKENQDLSPSSFFKFIMKSSDPNYSFMCDFTFELLDAVFMYRVGVRCNIPKFIMAGRAKFAKVWSGRNHPLYQELEMADSLCQIRMPEEVLNFFHQSASINLSDQPNHGEGADFRLEEVNKQVQKWLPNIPSTKDWEIACSNLDQLTLLREQIFAQMKITDPKNKESSPHQNIDQEIAAFRAELRKQEYLLHPHEIKEHVSLDGQVLDHELKNFCQLSRDKRADYVDIFLEHEKQAIDKKAAPPRYKSAPVFITVQEREQYMAIENKTIADIKLLISANIQKLIDTEVREVIEEMWLEIQRAPNKPSKQKILEFHYEVEGYLDQQSVVESDSSASE